MAPKTPPMDCDVITNVSLRPRHRDTTAGASAGRAARPQLANWSKRVSLDYSGIPTFTALQTRNPVVSKAPARASKQKSHFYIGIGGWTFPPWSGVFYPANAPRA